MCVSCSFQCLNSRSPSDELQLFYESSHKFQSLLLHQEPHPSPYDTTPTDEERGSGIFTKPANWAEFIEITYVRNGCGIVAIVTVSFHSCSLEPDPSQIISYCKIRDSVRDIDPVSGRSGLTMYNYV